MKCFVVIIETRDYGIMKTRFRDWEQDLFESFSNIKFEGNLSNDIGTDIMQHEDRTKDTNS